MEGDLRSHYLNEDLHHALQVLGEFVGAVRAALEHHDLFGLQVFRAENAVVFGLCTRAAK